MESKKTLHFDIDLGWLLNFYLQKKYEQMTKETDDVDYKLVCIYPLWDLIQDLDGEQLIKSFKDYLAEKGSMANEVLVTPELTKSWADWKMTELMNTDKYKDEVLKMSGSYVHDKKTGMYITCKFGEHAAAVRQLIKQVFRVDDIYSCIDLWPEFDKYILENLELKGTYFSESHYLMDRGRSGL